MNRLKSGLWHRRTIQLVRQSEVTECGLASLAMICGYYGQDVDLATLRRRFQLSLRGASLRSLIEISDQLGLNARPVRLPLERLAELQMPAVLHWEMRHFVVLEAVKNGKALIHDPEGRSRWLPLKDVSNHFTGVALELTPAADFEVGHARPKLRLFDLWSKVVGLKRSILQIIILSIVLEAYVLASPYYMQIAIDSVIPSTDIDLMTLLAIGFAIFVIINSIAHLLRSFVVLSAGSSLGLGIGVNVARRLMRLPVGWFEKRQIGDILSRFQSILPIQTFLTEGTVASLVDGSLAVVTLIVMFIYSPLLSLLTLFGVLLYIIVRIVSFRIQRRAEEDAIVTSGREQTILIDSLRGIVTIRLFDQASSRLSDWYSRYVDTTNSNIEVSRISIWQTTLSILIFGLESTLAIWIAIGYVIEGGFSIGMVFAFLAYKAQFVQKTVTLVDQGIAMRMLGLHLERLSDIAQSEEDRSFQTAHLNHHTFRGNVELKDVQFSYGPTDPLVLDGLNLSVRAGEHVAITGGSGEGKSTFLKVLLGLLPPNTGEIFIDGVPIENFAHKNFHKQISAVLQDDHLFSGSLADNIALFDPSPDHDRVVEAAKGAAIYEDIVKMQMGFETLVGDMGSALSGGQKQRILIARALYRRPMLLLMDEGTSHLDSQNERIINDTVAEMGITRIIIAHRRETIVRASTIYRMDNGKLTDVTSSYRNEVSGF